MIKLLLALIITISFSVKADDVVIAFGQSNAKGIATYGGHPVIDCSKGGQKIAMFLPNYDTRSLYGDCLKKMQGNKASAIIFWQGESDTVSKLDAAAWSMRASYVIRCLLQDFGAPTTKVVMVAINNRPNEVQFPYWAFIRQSQLNFPFIIVDSSTYPFEPNIGAITSPIHLTQLGYEMITADIFTKLGM